MFIKRSYPNVRVADYMFKKYFSGKESVPKDKLRQIAYLLQTGENITTLWLPGGGRTNFGIGLQNRSIFRFIYSWGLRRKLKKTIFLYLDTELNSFQLNQYLEETLSLYSTSKGIMSKVTDITEKGVTIYFVLDNVELTSLDVVNYLLTLRSIHRERIRFFNLVLIKDFYEIKSSNQRLTEAFFHNCIYIPYLSKEESLEWLDISAKQNRIRINKSIKEEIYEYSGGIPVILNNLTRYYRNYKDIEKCRESIEVKSLVESIWQKFSSKERKIITEVLTTETKQTSSIYHEYFSRIGLIDDQSQIRGKWLFDVGELSTKISSMTKTYKQSSGSSKTDVQTNKFN